jgi:hypothetical protein
VTLNVSEQLWLFVRRADELRSARMLRNTPTVGFTLQFDQMKGTRVELRQPDEEELRSLLLTLRQFVSDTEPVFLYRIHNLCERHLTSDVLRGYLRQAREQWKRSMKESVGGMQLVFNGRDWSPEFVADLYINGHYFHSDVDKAATLERLVPAERLLSRYQFLNFVLDTTTQVLYVSNVIRAANL